MLAHLLRQLLVSAVKFFIFLTLMFFFINVTMPGDFTDLFALAGRDYQEQLREQLGLDLLLWQQYVNWLQNILTGNLGDSFWGEPIMGILKNALPLTLLVFLFGAALAFLIGFLLGKAAAWRGPGLFSGLSTFAGTLFYTSFPPWLAWLVSLAFAGVARYRFRVRFGGLFGLTQNSGRIAATSAIWRETDLTPQAVAYYVVVSFSVGLSLALVTRLILRRLTQRTIPTVPLILMAVVGAAAWWFGGGFGEQAVAILQAAFVPILTFTLLSFGDTMLIMRTAMADVLGEQFVEAARAKGLPDKIVRDRHAARNALLPVLARLTVSLPYLLTGIVILEYPLDWPGLGTAIFNGVYQQDMPLVMGGLVIVGAITLFARLALDVAAAYLDPRIRFQEDVRAAA